MPGLSTYALIICFIMSLIHFMVHVLRLRFKQILEKNSINQSNQTRDIVWDIVSTIITAYLGFGALYRHGYFISSVSCSTIKSYDMSSYSFVLPCSVIMSYMLYDLMFNKLSNLYKFHHLISVIPLTILIIFSNSYGAYFTDVLLMTEISTVFLNGGFILTNLKRTISRVLFICTFMIFRPVLIIYVFLKMLECNDGGYFFMFMFTCLSLLATLNGYWTLSIIKNITRAFIKNKIRFISN